MAGRWEPVPRAQWAARIRLCRSRGAEHGWTDDTPGIPLSGYEPCEMCGVHVVGTRLANGLRGVVEVHAVHGDRLRLTAALGLSITPHDCPGRPRC